MIQSVLDLEPQGVDALWQYGVPGATELDETTIFFDYADGDEILNPVAPPTPSTWYTRQRISALRWNNNVVNKACYIYDSVEDRNRTREIIPAGTG